MSSIKALTLGIASFLCLALSLKVSAQEEEVKSGIVYYFSRYVEWPEEKQQKDFVIMVYGESSMTPHLEKMAQRKSAEGQKMVVKKIASLNEAAVGHILYLSDDKLNEFDDAIVFTEQHQMLLVTDAKGYGKKGANINFIVFDGKPSYEINEAAVAKNGLKVSQNLLRLGRRVK